MFDQLVIWFEIILFFKTGFILRVYFFSTCIGAAAFADTCVNGVKLLQNAGVEVIFKKDQTCCGQPSYNSGFYEETKRIALYNMDLFSENYPIVLPSGSCSGMMRVDYIELFHGTSHAERAREFCERIYDLSEFLDKVLNVRYEDKGDKTKVTWHSNCHALRVTKCIDSSKRLIRSLKNVELIELQKEEDCCGFGGTFSIKEAGIASVMVNQKIQDIQSRNVEYVLSSDAGCLLNISGAMKKQGIDHIKAVHLYDFIANRIMV